MLYLLVLILIGALKMLLMENICQPFTVTSERIYASYENMVVLILLVTFVQAFKMIIDCTPMNIDI